MFLYRNRLQDHFYYRCTDTELKFSWLPRHCDISGKRVWLEYAYRLTAVFHGPGDPVVEERWHKKEEHILWKLMK